jgi:hypothetical protein
MSTLKQLTKEQQMLHRAEAKQAVEKLKLRKQATRTKIELGGLVTKAELAEFPKNVLLGGFIYLSEQFTDNDFFELCKHKGNLAFNEIKE